MLPVCVTHGFRSHKTCTCECGTFFYISLTNFQYLCHGCDQTSKRFSANISSTHRADAHAHCISMDARARVCFNIEGKHSLAESSCIIQPLRRTQSNIHTHPGGNISTILTRAHFCRVRCLRVCLPNIAVQFCTCRPMVVLAYFRLDSSVANMCKSWARRRRTGEHIVHVLRVEFLLIWLNGLQIARQRPDNRVSAEWCAANMCVCVYNRK